MRLHFRLVALVMELDGVGPEPRRLMPLVLPAAMLTGAPKRHAISIGCLNSLPEGNLFMAVLVAPHVALLAHRSAAAGA